MNILTVYHGDSCIDGFTSAWLSTVAAEQAGHKVPELYPLTYEDGEEDKLWQHVTRAYNKDHKIYDVIYILDISLSTEGLENLTKVTNAKIVMLDHHKTAFERYVLNEPRTDNERASLSLCNGQVDIALNNGMSGAGMTYLYFFPDTYMPILVQHVQDRDIWKFKLANTKAVHQYLAQAEQTIDSWTSINANMCHQEGYKHVVDQGKFLMKQYETEVGSIAHGAKSVTIKGQIGFMVECDYKYASDVGHLLCKESGTFGMTYFTYGDSRDVKISLRSEGDYDVEVIAKQFGGGGHKNAAGFITTTEDIAKGILT